MEPITAVANCITEGFKFFMSPIGQRIAEDWLNLSIEARIALVKALTKQQ